MPIILADGDIIQVRVACTRGGQTAYMLRHFYVDTTVGSPLLEEAMQFIDLSLSPPLYALTAVGDGWLGVHAKRIIPSVSDELHSNNAVFTPPPGALPDMLPPAASALIRLRPDFSGKRSLGRLFVPFLPQSALGDDTRLEAGYKAALDGVAAGLTNPISVFAANGQCSLVPAIYHRGPQTASRIITGTGAWRIATQRRRGRPSPLTPPPPTP